MRVPVPDVLLPADQLGRVHFVGIGGAGLSGIARIMLARGITVSGSDAKESRAIEALRALGATVHVGHDAAQVRDADTLVISTAVREDNPEVVEAHRLGLRLLPRSAALESVMQGRRVVAVAGTHGKTTTTSLLTVALQHCAADPSFAIGGDLNETGSNAHDGAARSSWPRPTRATRLPRLRALRGTGDERRGGPPRQLRHGGGLPRGLHDVPRPDRPRGLPGRVHRRPRRGRPRRAGSGKGPDVVGIGESDRADLRAEGLEFEGSTSRFTVFDHGRRLGLVALQIPGRHYVLDAMAALAAGLRLGVRVRRAAPRARGVHGHPAPHGVQGRGGGVRVYDSYAHHPNEIAGDLQAARSLAGEGRVVVAFQPHLVSRTKIFGPAMGEALGAADEVVVMDVYVAREDPEPGVNGALVASHVPLPAEQVLFEPSWSRTPAALVERARPGDLVLTLGAGDVTLVGPEVLELLAEREPDEPVHPRRARPRPPGDDAERTVRDRPQALRAPAVGPALAGLAPVVAAVVVLVLVGRLGLAGVRLLGAGRLGRPGGGHRRAQPRAVRRAAAVPTGSPLATVDLDAIRGG